MTRRKTSSPAECGYTFRGDSCPGKGDHYCRPRADRVVTFFSELLVHTKGVHARTPFVLAGWQEVDIVRPLFGTVRWSDEFDRYVRRFTVAYIVIARKNGKSELAAAIQLYLLVGDDEESAEIYGAAKDTKQAGKVFEPALRMMQLSPTLRKRLKHNKNSRRIYDEKTASYYEIITSDAEGELGHNPHGFVLDEVLSQPDDSLWNAMRTAAGTRTQPLMLAITTETNQPASFGASLIDEAERIQADQGRAPHIFAYVRKTPDDADPWDETVWTYANPALGDFLTWSSLRQEALEARNDPSKENAFRQYRLNQRVQQVTRYVPMELWNANVGEVAVSPEWLVPKLEGRRCWAGLDLSSKLDLTAWALLFDDGWVTWRFWAPESVVPLLDKHTDGRFPRWASDGWVKVTDGDVIDYDQVYADIGVDHDRYAIDGITYDKWSGEPVRQQIEKRTGLSMVESDTTYTRMTAPMLEFMRLLTDRGLKHGGNPVAGWMAEALEAKHPADDPDRVRPVKPDRGKSGKRIDGLPALFFALDGKLRAPAAKRPNRIIVSTSGG